MARKEAKEKEKSTKKNYYYERKRKLAEMKANNVTEICECFFKPFIFLFSGVLIKGSGTSKILSSKKRNEKKDRKGEF